MELSSIYSLRFGNETLRKSILAFSRINIVFTQQKNVADQSFQESDQLPLILQHVAKIHNIPYRKKRYRFILFLAGSTLTFCK